MLSVLRNWNFTALLIGRFLANIGDSFYAIAAMWLVYNLGGSTFYTGLALFLTSIPAIFQVVLGPVIDRFSVKKLLVVTQLMQAILLLIVPLFFFLDLLTIAVVLTVMPIISLFNQFLYPTQLSVLPKILKKEQLTHGNSLFALAYQGSQAAFNSLAGVVLILVGAVSIFYINSITFVLSALVLLTLRLPFARTVETEKSVSVKAAVSKYKQDLVEGLAVLKKPIFSRMLFGVIFINLGGVAIYAVLPAFSEGLGGAEWYGFFMAAAGIGTIVGSLAASTFKLYQYKMGPLYSLLIVLCGACWLLTGLVPNGWLALTVFALGWVPAGMINVLSQVMIQSVVPPQLTGRVMAAVIGLSVGAAPVGALLGGAIGQVVGSSMLIVGSGCVIMLVSVYWMMNKYTRTIPAAQDMSPAILGLQENAS